MSTPVKAIYMLVINAAAAAYAVNQLNAKINEVQKQIGPKKKARYSRPSPRGIDNIFAD